MLPTGGVRHHDREVRGSHFQNSHPFAGCQTHFTMKTNEICAAVLAGGGATRYGGRPKGLIEISPGRTIIRNVLEQIRAAGIQETVIIANDPGPYKDLGLQILADLRPGNGPLGGIETALDHYSGRCTATLFLPCDLPGIRSAHIEKLADSVDPQNPGIVVAVTGDSFMHALCSIMHNDMIGEAKRALDMKHLAVNRFIRSHNANEVFFEDEEAFFNINSPEDLARWEKRMSG